MRRFLIKGSWSFFQNWRFFNLPTPKEEQVLRKWKRGLDTAAGLIWKIFLTLAMVFEVKRRRKQSL